MFLHLSKAQAFSRKSNNANQGNEKFSDILQ
ncbi:hypothetical protein DEU53_103125 [Pantoea sp. AG1095]|nr:hypothetical protein DEU53_103125 [Pantoea sp. AG1095]